MGLSATGDEYCRRGAEITDHLDNTERVIDDTLIHDRNLNDHIARVRNYLEECRKHRVTLNRKKFEFAQEEVKFVGFIVGKNGVKADPAKIEAIKKFPEPSNITELRSFLGLAN